MSKHQFHPPPPEVVPPPPPTGNPTWMMGPPAPPDIAAPCPPAPPTMGTPTWMMGSPAPPDTAAPLSQQHFPSSSSSSSSSSYYGNPYVHISPAPPPTKSAADTFWKVLEKAGKKLEDTSRKAANTGSNVWSHLKAGNNLTDAAMSRLSQETKVFAEGGHEKIFQQRFGIIPGEQLLKTYVCYLSTSADPVIGILYLSTLRLAFCSDNPLRHTPSPGHQEWIHYKVVVQLPQLRAVIPSANIKNPAEKYIQIIAADGHEFWFLGFVNYDKALKNLTAAVQHQPVYF